MYYDTIRDMIILRIGSKYEYETRYHLGKANVVIEALRGKERVKPRRVRAMAMTIQNRAVSGTPVLWAEIRESSLIGPELVQEMTDKVVLIKEKLKAVSDRQKSCADNRRKPLEFEVEDRVMLKVSPWKGVIRFGKKGKLAPSGYAAMPTFCGQAQFLAVRYLVKVSWNSKENLILKSIERDRLIGIDLVGWILWSSCSFTFSDKRKMILVIEGGFAVNCIMEITSESLLSSKVGLVSFYGREVGQLHKNTKVKKGG
ncbi:hypothetical protein Tco_0517756 [Tanacetum coccineum]